LFVQIFADSLRAVTDEIAGSRALLVIEVVLAFQQQPAGLLQEREAAAVAQKAIQHPNIRRI